MSAGSADKEILQDETLTDEVDKEVVGTDAPADTEEQPAVEPTQEEEADEPEAPESPQSWVDDTARELAASYGLKDEDLARYGSADDFYRAAANFDRGFTKPQPKADEKKSDTKAETDFDPQRLIDGEYDEEIVAMAKQVQAMEARLKESESRFQSIEQSRQEAGRQQLVHEFHDEVDKLDPTLFGVSVDDKGEPVDLDPVRDANRRRLWNAMDQIAAGIVSHSISAGEQPALPPPRVLVRRALNMEFGDDLRRVESAKRTEAIRKQSTRRRPAGTKRTVGSPTPDSADPLTAEDRVQQIMANPKLAQKIREIKEAQGM